MLLQVSVRVRTSAMAPLAPWYWRGMPFVAEASVRLDVSPEVAFARLADHGSWHDWMPRTFRPTSRTPKTLAKGDVVKIRIGFAPFGTPVEVYVVEPSTELTWGGGVTGVIQARHRFLFDADGTGTVVRSVETWSGPMASVLRRIVKPAAERIGRDQLRALADSLR
jgi:hypothetical protein